MRERETDRERERDRETQTRTRRIALCPGRERHRVVAAAIVSETCGLFSCIISRGGGESKARHADDEGIKESMEQK